jgi:hypothetical protein
MNIKLLPFVDFDVSDLRIDRGHERPKQIIINDSNKLAKDIVLFPPKFL